MKYVQYNGECQVKYIQNSGECQVINWVGGTAPVNGFQDTRAWNMICLIRFKVDRRYLGSDLQRRTVPGNGNYPIGVKCL